MNLLRPPVLASSGPRAGATLRSSLAPRLVAWCLGAVAMSAAWAGDELDHERARAAVLAGEVLPLSTLLDKLRRTHRGQVLELELERDDGRWIYEVKLLQPDGQLLKLELDAGTGQVLQVKRKPDRSKDRNSEASKEAAK